MEDRYIACMVLHAVGDTIGFKNGEWEFMSGRPEDKIMEKMYEFINLGGIMKVPNSGWNVSDDTLMHMANARVLIGQYENLDELNDSFRSEYIKSEKALVEDDKRKRGPGIQLIKSIDSLKMKHKVAYDLFAGGSGASMRSSCIGLAFYGEQRRNLLIQVSIDSSRLTHNSAVGYLGGFTSALFTSLAIEGVDVKRWGFVLMDLIEGGKVSEYVKGFSDFSNYEEDKHVFIEKWKRFLDNKFDGNGKIKMSKSSKNLIYRVNYYHKNFSFEKKPEQYFPGSGGDDSVIIAYDSLLDSGNNWEKLVVYSMLHAGDTDTTGCIAASWFGALYGFKTTPKFEYVEFEEDIRTMGKELFKKYYA